MICQMLQECFDDEHSAAVISKVGSTFTCGHGTGWSIGNCVAQLPFEATNGFWGLAAWLHERMASDSRNIVTTSADFGWLSLEGAANMEKPWIADCRTILVELKKRSQNLVDRGKDSIDSL